MRLPLSTTCALVVVLLQAGSALACGEKFLVPGGSIDARCVNAPSRTLSILIYGTDESQATASLARKNVVAALEGVGHKVIVCKSANDCRGEIEDGAFDVVLVDAATARMMKGASASGARRATVVVPVILTKSRAEAATAKHEFGRVVNAQDDELKILPAVDRAASAKSSH